MAEMKDILTALGIAEDADPVAAIANLRAEIASLKETIASDKTTADVAENARLRMDLVAAQQRLLSIESENAAKIRQIEIERRREQAVAKVDALIMKGLVKPVNRDVALGLAETLSAEKFDEYVATLTPIDMTERGVATGSELAELEPTATEIAIAKQMGTWDENKPNESRLALMRVKAKDRGLVLPAEVK